MLLGKVQANVSPFVACRLLVFIRMVLITLNAFIARAESVLLMFISQSVQPTRSFVTPH